MSFPNTPHSPPSSPGPPFRPHRDQVLSLRLRLQQAYTGLESSVRRLETSLEQLQASVLDRPRAQLDHVTVAECHRLLVSDKEETLARIYEVRSLHSQLNPQEFDLLQRECDDLPSLGCFPGTGLVDTGEQGHASDVVGLPHGRGPDLPLLLEKYFDVLGDINLERERLQDELPAYYAEQVADRERARDQDELLSQTDEEFWQAHDEQVREAERNLAILTDEAARLRLRCEKAGYDINPEHYRTRSESSSVPKGVENWLGDLSTPDDRLPLIGPTIESEPGSMRSSAREVDEPANEQYSDRDDALARPDKQAQQAASASCAGVKGLMNNPSWAHSVTSPSSRRPSQIATMTTNLQPTHGVKSLPIQQVLEVNAVRSMSVPTDANSHPPRISALREVFSASDLFAQALFAARSTQPSNGGRAPPSLHNLSP